MSRTASSARLLSQRAFLLLQQLVEALLGDQVQEFLNFPSRLDPLADGGFQSVRDIEHGPLRTAADGQIQRDMLVALLAAATGLSAGAGHFDEAAAEQGLLGQAFDSAGAGVPFFGRALERDGIAVASGRLIYYNISEGNGGPSEFSNANLLRLWPPTGSPERIDG